MVRWSPGRGGAWGTANVSDRRFLPLVWALEGRSVTLADVGFRDPPGTRSARTPPNLKVCRRGVWNERMLIETLLSLVHRVCRLKYLWHRAAPYLDAHLAYVAALVTALLALNARATSRDPYPPPRFAHYAL